MNKNYEEFKKECTKAMEVLGIYDRALEMRMIKTKKGTISGYYENKEKLLRDTFRYDGVNNIFFTLNVFSEDLLARGKDKLIEYASHTTSDSEITRRELLLIDVDPKRPAGVSSTDEELQSSKIVLMDVVNFLTSEGFPEPVIACSGNGYHALYKVDSPNTKEVTQLYKEFLYALDSKFSNEKAQIDKTTYNPARITKMYGTIACKGDSTESRPHRRSRIVQAPNEFNVVDESLLKKVSELYTNKNTTSKKVSTVHNKSVVKGSINIEEWLREKGLDVSKVKEEVDRTVYVLEKCPWNSNHTDKSASITQFNTGAISAKCHHDSCSHENWSSLKSLYEPKASKNKSEYSEKEYEEPKKSYADIVIEQALNYNDVFFHNSVEETFVAVDKDKFYEVYRLEDKKYQNAYKKEVL